MSEEIYFGQSDFGSSYHQSNPIFSEKTGYYESAPHYPGGRSSVSEDIISLDQMQEDGIEQQNFEIDREYHESSVNMEDMSRKKSAF